MTDSLDITTLTEEQSYAAMKAIDRSGPGRMKSAFIVIKAFFVIYKTLKAAKVWYKSEMPMGKPSALVLALSAFTIVMGAIFKFSHKRILPLFLLQSLGNYCAFCVFHVLIGYVQNKQSAERRAQICKQLKIIHVLWWISAAFGS